MTSVQSAPPTRPAIAEADAALRAEISRLVGTALEEDVGTGDVTSTATLSPTAACSGTIVSRACGVVSGLMLVEAVYEALPGAVSVERLLDDGDAVEPGTPLADVRGDARVVLSGERTALNFLGHLSGIATLTRAYVDAVAETGATILDTRKTTPGMRHVEKHAVRCGGGTNHRLGLYDAVLIKDNHLMLSGAIEEAVARARAACDLEITVEVENLDQLEQALASGADRILLDNMSVGLMRQAVARVGGLCPLEASGGVDLATVAEIAATGVDYISVGSITHSAPALDLSMEVRA